MGPYRTPPELPEHDVEPPANDDRVLAALLLFIGGARVAIAFAQREAFGAEATTALFMIAMAVGLLLRSLRTSRGQPR
jgi:hypothetical protein